MEDRFILAPEVRRITSLSQTTIWRLEHAKKFPRRRKISPGRVGWLMSEVSQWLDECAVAS